MPKSLPNKPLVTIIILNYNSGRFLASCLQSIVGSIYTSFDVATIIVDNVSTDTSFEDAKKIKLPKSLFIKTTTNNGFAAGNNFGIKHLNPQTKYVLFLNPDTTLDPHALQSMFDFFKSNQNIAAATGKLILATTNQIQPECHRGFPTPWRSFCHFSGLGKLIPHSALFNGYFLGNLDYTKPQQIEACSGALLMIRKEIGAKINWWSNDYFFYGEDLDLCFQLYKRNLELWYNPDALVTHFQGISSGIKKHSKDVSTATLETKIKIAKASTEAMRIFYRRNYFNTYPPIIRFFTNLAINLLETKRVNDAQKQS